MKLRILLGLLLVIFIASPTLRAQELDGSDLRKEAREREERVNNLPIEERQKLVAAQRVAINDPAVQAALQKRDRAMLDFRAAIRAAMIKADPSVAPIIQKVELMERLHQ